MSAAVTLGVGATAGFAAALAYACVPAAHLGVTFAHLVAALRAAADPATPLPTAFAEIRPRVRLVMIQTLRTLPATCVAAVVFGAVYAGAAAALPVQPLWPSGLAGAGLGAVVALIAVRRSPTLPRRWP